MGDLHTRPCYVDGVRTEALLDSGSQVTLIYRDFFESLGLPLRPLQDLVLLHGGDGKMPYLGWTEINLGFDATFCGTDRAFPTLALVVPNSKSTANYKLIVGTNSGVFRECYSSLQGGTQRVPIDRVCEGIYKEIRGLQRIGSEGLIGYVKSRAAARMVVPAGSTQYVVGQIRNRLGRAVTGLLDSTVPS